MKFDGHLRNSTAEMPVKLHNHHNIQSRGLDLAVKRLTAK